MMKLGSKTVKSTDFSDIEEFGKPQCNQAVLMMPYFHLKHYIMAIQLFDPYWCALSNRVKDIHLDLWSVKGT